MTLPYERLRAVNYAREFLYELLDPKKTPKVPKAVRQQAYRVLRHYPYPFEMKMAAEKAPDLFEAPNDAVDSAVQTEPLDNSSSEREVDAPFRDFFRNQRGGEPDQEQV